MCSRCIRNAHGFAALFCESGMARGKPSVRPSYWYAFVSALARSKRMAVQRLEVIWKTMPAVLLRRCRRRFLNTSLGSFFFENDGDGNHDGDIAVTWSKTRHLSHVWATYTYSRKRLSETLAGRSRSSTACVMLWSTRRRWVTMAVIYRLWIPGIWCGENGVTPQEPARVIHL